MTPEEAIKLFAEKFGWDEVWSWLRAGLNEYSYQAREEIEFCNSLQVDINAE